MDDIKNILPFAFPFFFVGMWCMVLKILSIMSGWSKLATKYATSEKCDGRKYRFQSARMGIANFNGCLTMGVSKSGFYIVPFILFRLFHPPLLIPWGEIYAEQFKRFFFLKGYRLSFQSIPGVSLELSNRTFDKMIDYLKEQTGFQTDSADSQARG